MNPNPFVGETTVAFTLAEPAYVIFEVFDLTGRRVATLADGVVSAGNRSLKFESGNLSAGIYICRFRAGAFSATKQMTLR
ncbi:MAG TPA: T9SS type A sorting domain-containing protein [Rhodothermales bacterium]|nr:T9SS type A sorting domain-containing protein [Rhodothermales bacterium]